jgi:hypothetical protein
VHHNAQQIPLYGVPECARIFSDAGGRSRWTRTTSTKGTALLGPMLRSPGTPWRLPPPCSPDLFARPARLAGRFGRPVTESNATTPVWRLRSPSKHPLELRHHHRHVSDGSRDPGQGDWPAQTLFSDVGGQWESTGFTSLSRSFPSGFPLYPAQAERTIPLPIGKIRNSKSLIYMVID